MQEQEEYQVIKSLVEHNGNRKRAALKLQRSKRTIDRYIKGYQEEGKDFFSHGNHHHKPARTLPEDTKQLIVNLYQSKYFDATYAHFTELLVKFENIHVSESSVRKILKAENIPSPQSTRKTKRLLLSQQTPNDQGTKAQPGKSTPSTRITDREDAHPRRPRCANFGEMIQMDASLHPWMGSSKTTLHIAVDDACGFIVGAYFDEQETLNGYYHLLYQILTTFGIPFMFYTDRRTVFEYKQMANPVLEKDSFTQFGYACHQLGIEIKTTSVPQAKGRVERMFGTLQSRLPVLLRQAGVTTLEQANEFLHAYIPEFNAQFALPYDPISSVFETQPSDEKINLTLAIMTKRKVDSGHCIHWDNQLWRIVNASGDPVYLYPGTLGLVIQAFDKALYFCLANDVFSLEEVPLREQVSPNFNFDIPKQNPRTRYIPPLSHPWRQASLDRYLRKQAHRNDEK